MAELTGSQGSIIEGLRNRRNANANISEGITKDVAGAYVIAGDYLTGHVKASVDFKTPTPSKAITLSMQASMPQFNFLGNNNPADDVIKTWDTDETREEIALAYKAIVDQANAEIAKMLEKYK